MPNWPKSWHKMSFWSEIINWILPPRCLKCGKILPEDIGLCQNCLDAFNFISGPYCKKCGFPLENADGNRSLLCAGCLRRKRSPLRLSRSACVYDEASKPLILDFKFHDKTDNAGILARMMLVAGRDIWEKGVDVMIPVPLHYTRMLKRRFNQSALLAREVHKLNGVPVDFGSLKRRRKTRPQVEFSGHERVNNVKGAFTVKDPCRIKGKRVLLLDDVMTTGSTLKECALALKRAGAKSVDTLTIARVV